MFCNPQCESFPQSIEPSLWRAHKRRYLRYYFSLHHLPFEIVNYLFFLIKKFKFWLVLLPRAWTMAYASNGNVSYKCFKTILCWTLIDQFIRPNKVLTCMFHQYIGTYQILSIDLDASKYWELLTKSKTNSVFKGVYIYFMAIQIENLAIQPPYKGKA